ncbi:Rad51 family DNA repair protein [Teratosphaeria destructans]|uniref:Rad51 family DNA repair protein n=1 Tax=Teratosphaeria destructans TaxID=418781 RepID=A0A9W7SWG4_9PEZI|nr:Rad51 family DNA repair protein [Teratosphaeria destructans]
MAEDLGKRLLAEVEEVGLDEIFQLLRAQDESQKQYFGLPQLDRLISIALENKLPASKTKSTQPVMIELMSNGAGGGKTHLLYHMLAHAVLPTTLPGKQACAVVLDTDGHFNIPRLAQQLQHLCSRRTHPAQSHDETVHSALRHIHLFRPQSLASTIATLASLPTYLFDETRRRSFDRPLALIALDSASAFYWPTRAEEEAAALFAATTPGAARPTSLPTWTHLSAALKDASTAFSCPIILTSWNLNRSTAMQQHGHGGEVQRMLRPSLPAPLSQLATVRFIVQRLPVRKFPVGISIEEAQREAESRQKAVEEGRFECMVNEWGLDERLLQKLQRAGAGFSFTIKDVGLLVGDERIETEL